MPPTDASVDLLEFFGVVVPGKNTVDVEVADNESEFEIMHITNVALGAEPKDGPHTVSIIHEGRETVLGTLKAGLTYQFPLDLGITNPFRLRNHGASPVSVTGFRTRTVLEDFSDDGLDEDEDEDEDAPDAVPLAGTRRAKQMALARGFQDLNGMLGLDDDDDDDEDEDASGMEDEDEDEDDDGGMMEDMADVDSEEEEGEGSDEDEEDDEDEEGGGFLPALGEDDFVAGIRGGDDDDEDDDLDEDEDEDDEDEEDEADEEEEEMMVQAKKRAAPQTPQAQPSKKHKDAGGKAVPASAPPKMQQGKQQGSGGGTGDAAWAAALAAALRAEGKPMALSALGSKVKKPEGTTMKLGALIRAHADKFVMDAKQEVSLKKK